MFGVVWYYVLLCGGMLLCVVLYGGMLWYMVSGVVWCCVVLCVEVCWYFVVSGGVLQFLVVYGVVRL